jgi:hypothetical protein
MENLTRYSTRIGTIPIKVPGIPLDDQLHSYHYLRSAHNFTDDSSLRIQFCEWLLHQYSADEFLLNNILWTDEACFTLDDVFYVQAATSDHGNIPFHF